jgi:hypothetical protein
MAASTALAQEAKHVGTPQKGQPGTPSYVRPNFRMRLRTYADNTFGPIKLSRVVFGAAISQADGVPPEWGQGWNAYGDRVASHLGVAVVDGGANLMLSEALRENTTYYPCPCKGIWPRLKHALASSVTAHKGADGYRVFSVPAVASPYAGAFISLLWYPPRYGPKDAFRTGNYDLVDSIGAKVALEFLSPLFQKLHHRK